MGKLSLLLRHTLHDSRAALAITHEIRRSATPIKNGTPVALAISNAQDAKANFAYADGRVLKRTITLPDGAALYVSFTYDIDEEAREEEADVKTRTAAADPVQKWLRDMQRTIIQIMADTAVAMDAQVGLIKTVGQFQRQIKTLAAKGANTAKNRAPLVRELREKLEHIAQSLPQEARLRVMPQIEALKKIAFAQEKKAVVKLATRHKMNLPRQHEQKPATLKTSHVRSVFRSAPARQPRAGRPSFLQQKRTAFSIPRHRPTQTQGSHVQGATASQNHITTKNNATFALHAHPHIEAAGSAPALQNITVFEPVRESALVAALPFSPALDHAPVLPGESAIAFTAQAPFQVETTPIKITSEPPAPQPHSVTVQSTPQIHVSEEPVGRDDKTVIAPKQQELAQHSALLSPAPILSFNAPEPVLIKTAQEAIVQLIVPPAPLSSLSVENAKHAVEQKIAAAETAPVKEAFAKTHIEIAKEKNPQPEVMERPVPTLVVKPPEHDEKGAVIKLAVPIDMVKEQPKTVEVKPAVEDKTLPETNNVVSFLGQFRAEMTKAEKEREAATAGQAMCASGGKGNSQPKPDAKTPNKAPHVVAPLPQPKAA